MSQAKDTRSTWRGRIPAAAHCLTRTCLASATRTATEIPDTGDGQQRCGQKRPGDLHADRATTLTSWWVAVLGGRSGGPRHLHAVGDLPGRKWRLGGRHGLSHRPHHLRPGRGRRLGHGHHRPFWDDTTGSAWSLWQDKRYQIDLEGADTSRGTLANPHLFHLYDSSGTQIPNTGMTRTAVWATTPG